MSLPFQLPSEFKLGNPNEVLPKPEEVMAAVTAVPPKLSVLQSIPAVPEVMFEKAVYDATKQAIPPGPNRMLASLMASIEASLPAPPALPAALPFPPMPKPAAPAAPAAAPPKVGEGIVF
jgi:hypothetical protein